MRSFAFGALVGAAAIVGAAGGAGAADMPEPVYKAPMVEVVPAGWYLRGDIGFSNQQVDRLYDYFDSTTEFTWLQKDFDAAPFFVLGAGYRFNEWLRVDVTGEYRGKSDFNGLDSYYDEEEGIRYNDYEAQKSEWTFLANLYVDLGTWYSITPFVGVGVGTSRNTISGYTDTEVGGLGGFGYASDASKWNFAWAVYAGLAYEVTPGFTIEFAYRYLDLGDGITGDVIGAGGVNNYYNPMNFSDLTSHDLKVGFRWALGGGTTTVVSKY